MGPSTKDVRGQGGGGQPKSDKLGQVEGGSSQSGRPFPPYTYGKDEKKKQYACLEEDGTLGCLVLFRHVF